MMKKTFILLALLFSVTALFAQSSEWGSWTSCACYSKIMFRLKVTSTAQSKNSGFLIEFKSSYPQKVTFAWDGFVDLNEANAYFGRGAKGTQSDITLSPGQSNTYGFSLKQAGFRGAYIVVSRLTIGQDYQHYQICDTGVPCMYCGNFKDPYCPNYASASAGSSGQRGGTGTATSVPIQPPTLQAVHTANTSPQQVILQQQQQELQRQQAIQQLSDQIAGGVLNFIVAGQIKKSKKRQEALANYQADKQLVADADSGNFGQQLKLAAAYADNGQFALAEYYYSLAIQNTKETEDSRNSHLHEYAATLALQDKKKQLYSLLQYVKSNNIKNEKVSFAAIILEAFCGNYSVDGINCNDDTRAQGIRSLLAIKEENPIAKIIYSYMQVTGDYEKYGVAKNKEEGLKMLEQMSKDKFPHDAALFYLGMIYNSGTSDIKKNEYKAFKYFLKSAYFKGPGMGDLREAPLRLNDTYAYFNFSILSYIKAAEFSARSASPIDAAVTASMRAELVRLRFLIPESDRQYFPGFWQ